MIEHALRRELYQDHQASGASDCFNIDEHGLPVFGKNNEPMVTSEEVYRMMEELGV